MEYNNSRLSELLSSRVSDQLLNAMFPFGTPNLGGDTYTTTQKEPTTFDEGALKKAIDSMWSVTIEDQKRMIKMLASVGFKVMCNSYTGTGAYVILPKRYADAMEQLNKQPQQPEDKRVKQTNIDQKHVQKSTKNEHIEDK